MDASPATALKLALGAFVLLLVSPFLPLLELAAFVLAAGSVLLLLREARGARGARAARWPGLALALLVASFVALFVGGPFAARAFARGDIATWGRLVWVYALANVALAGAFYAAPLHLAGSRARLLLGLALGIAVAVAASTTWREVEAGQRFDAQRAAIAAQHPAVSAAENATRENLTLQAEDAFRADAESLLAAQGIPYVVFAWAYATTLGSVRRGAAEHNA